MRRTTLLLAAIAVGAAACGGAGDPSVAPSRLPTSAPSGADTATPTEGEGAPTPPTDDGADDGSSGDGGDVDGGDGGDGGDVATGVDERWIVAAKRDLAAHLGVDVADITVVEGGQVDWNDSSLGCPQPGQAYLQVITPGYRLVLAHSGTRHHYHGARDREPIRCERPAEGGYSSSSDV